MFACIYKLCRFAKEYVASCDGKHGKQAARQTSHTLRRAKRRPALEGGGLSPLSKEEKNPSEEVRR